MLFRDRYIIPLLWERHARDLASEHAALDGFHPLERTGGAGPHRTTSAGRHDGCDPRHNVLLGSLPDRELDPLRPYLEPVVLPRGRTLHRCEDFARHVVFPLSAVVGVSPRQNLGTAAQLALIGAEGAVGAPLGTGIEVPAEYRCLVQVAGIALRIDRRHLSGLDERGLPSLLQRWSFLLRSQVVMLRDCNEQHTVLERLCRWLLMMQDRVGRDLLPCSSRFLWRRLGARCEEVECAGISLQRLGILDFEGEQVRVVDRTALELATCRCYSDLNQAYHRIIRFRTL